MFRFFIDTTNGFHVKDEEGLLLPNSEAARKLAFAAVGEMLKDMGRSGQPVRCHAIVRDQTGAQLFTITGGISEAG